MNTTRWIIGLAGILAMSTAAAQCPTDEASRFIALELDEDEEEKILVEQDLTIRIDAHDFDTLQIGVSEGAPLVFQKTALDDLPGADTGLSLRIGPRKSAAKVIIGESQKILWAKTLKGNVCKSETRRNVFGGDSRVTAIVIGIEDYENVRDLEFAEEDALKFAELLRETIPDTEFNPVLLIGANATLREIRKAIYEAAGNASAFGSVLVYFSGHGTLVKDTTTKLIAAYYVPQDAHDELPPDLLEHAWVVEKLSTSKAANKILISDSCFSGTSLSRSVRAPAADFGHSKSLFWTNAPTLITEAFSKQGQWFKTSPQLLMFSSSSGTEVSYESTQLQSGLFTHYLLKSLSPGETSYLQAKAMVEAKIAGEHQGVQTPGLSGDVTLTTMHFPLTVRGDAP